MKKLLSLLLMLGLLCSLCACAESRQDETVPTEEPGVTEEPADPTADQSQTPVSDGDLALTSGGQVADEPWPELTEEESAGGYVRLHNYVRIDYVNTYTQEPYDAHYIVPEFTLESEDALACNQEIRETCDPIVEQAVEHAKTSPYVDVEISYVAGYWNGMVSICVKIASTADQYLVYTLDTQTGERLDDAEVALRAGVREDTYWQTLESAVTQHYGDWIDEGAPMGNFIELRNKTRSQENLEDMELFLGEGGALMAAAWIYNDIGSGQHRSIISVEVDPVDRSGALMGLWADVLADRRNADQYVTLALEEEKTFTAEDGEEVSCTYRLPKVLLNSNDASAYTEELQDRLASSWRGGVYATEDGDCCVLDSADYQSWVWEDTLTVLVTMKVHDMAYVWCSVATFDLNSGQRLDNAAVFMRLTGQETAASMEEIMAENLGLYFDQFHAQGEDDEKIAQRREGTVTWTGMGMTAPVLYPGPDGTMMALATIDSPLAHRSFMALVPMDELALLELSVTPGEDARLEELVTVYDHSIVKFTNDQKETYYIEMTIPQLNIDTPDGRACNWELQDILGRSKAERNEAFAVGPVTKLGDIGYDAWIWAGTLTLVAWDRANEEQCDYYIYVFDLRTGERLDNVQVAALLGLTEEQAKEKAKNAMLEAFEQKFFGDKETAYLNQKNATLDEDNMARITLYPSAEGKLMVLCRIVVYPEGVGQPCWYLLPTE